MSRCILSVVAVSLILVFSGAATAEERGHFGGGRVGGGPGHMGGMLNHGGGQQSPAGRDHLAGRKDAFRKEGNGTGKFSGKSSQGKFTPKRKGSGGLDIGDIIDAVGGLLPDRN